MAQRLSPILLATLLVPYIFAVSLVLRLVAAPLVWLRPAAGAWLVNQVATFWGVGFVNLARWVARVRVRVSGFRPDPGKSYLILSNHQGIADIALLFWLFRDARIKFVMKKELEHGIPNVSFGSRLARYAFLDREAGGEAAERELARFCHHATAEGAGVVIFPEGTRSRDGELRRFKVGGVAILAQHLDLDVVVVTLDGTWRIARPRDLLRHLHGLELRAHIEEPTSIEPLRADPAAALEEVRARMQQRLSELRGRPPRHQARERRAALG